MKRACTRVRVPIGTTLVLLFVVVVYLAFLGFLIGSCLKRQGNLHDGPELTYGTVTMTATHTHTHAPTFLTCSASTR